MAFACCSPAALFVFFTGRVRFLHTYRNLVKKFCSCHPSIEEQEGLSPQVGHDDGWPLVCNEIEGADWLCALSSTGRNTAGEEQSECLDFLRTASSGLAYFLC